jgi:hypothetical protein
VNVHTKSRFDEPTIKPVENMKAFIFLLLLTGINVACSDDLDQGVPCDSVRTNRIGAKCMDGSTSTATGSGACSHHGGVDYWICK